MWASAKQQKKSGRWKIQLLATLATNPFLLNFTKGKLYRGPLKTVCVPGLNCYSCPAAVGSCPIGSLQAVIGSPKYSISLYILGILAALGVLLGRVVCGFLCPFGWFQELLHKIPGKKFSTRPLRFLTWLKYVILVLFVIVLPMTVVNEVGLADPFFCKYICPAGILEGGIPLALTNESIRASLGELFTWKSCVLLGIVVLSVFFYRPFCKWICPLGAFYALFNRVSLCRLSVDEGKCTPATPLLHHLPQGQRDLFHPLDRVHRGLSGLLPGLRAGFGAVRRQQEHDGEARCSGQHLSRVHDSLGEL